MNERSFELTWNSSGIIFIDQISIPNSNIFVLFPYLFKAKRPKNLVGFEDFYNKIHKMGLSDLIYKKPQTYSANKETKKNISQSTQESDNWWFLD
jgi:hypothetical protein